MKHINKSMEDLQKKNLTDVGPDSSLLQRILALNKDPKLASILALDMFLVGIDTVKFFLNLKFKIK